LATDLKHEIVRTFMRPADSADADQLTAIFGEMEDATRALLRGEDVPDERTKIRREIDMCYIGQSFQLRILLDDEVGEKTGAVMTDAFHDRHEAVYGFCNRTEPTQFVNLRLTAIGQVERPRLRELEKAADPVDRAHKGTRRVYFREAGGMVDCALYDREKLSFDDGFRGPAIVEQMDTTTVVPPGASVKVDRFGSLLISVEDGA
jgi:N-methylhydantoinase A